MSLFLFTKKIIADELIDVTNNGDHSRDFTYIDDIVEGVARMLDLPATPNAAWNRAVLTPARRRRSTAFTISATTTQSS